MSSNEKASHIPSAPQTEPIQSKPEKQSPSTPDSFDEIAALPGLTPELKAKIHTVVSSIESMNLGISGTKNQKEKFLNDLIKQIDPKDVDMTEIGIDTELNKWNTAILPELVKKAELAAVSAEKTAVSAEKAEIGAVVKETMKEEKEGVVNTSAEIKRYAEALTQKISTLSGGKTPEQLLPDYSTKLEQTRQDLISKGQDPEMAKGVVLLSYQGDIIQSIEKTTGKKLDERDIHDLQQDFSTLRGMIPKGVEIPERNATNIALADPKVSLEAYSKIKLGFEPPTQLVYTNSKNGEIISPPALLTGERTVMTTDGNRFREKNGLRIPSPVPNISEAESLIQNLNVNKQDLAQRKRVTDVMSQVTQGEVLEKFPPNQFPKLQLPELSTNSPEDLQQQLTSFFSSEGYREIRNNPDRKLDVDNLEQRLKNLYQSVTVQSQLTKNIKQTEAKKPEEIVRARVAEQDRTIDSNLSRLTKLGMGALGQEKYEKVRDTLNKKLKQSANPAIDDQGSITESQGAMMRQALLKLTGMTEAEMYPDGSISETAKSKLNNVTKEDIENKLLGAEQQN